MLLYYSILRDVFPRGTIPRSANRFGFSVRVDERSFVKRALRRRRRLRPVGGSGEERARFDGRAIRFFVRNESGGGDRVTSVCRRFSRVTDPRQPNDIVFVHRRTIRTPLPIYSENWIFVFFCISFFFCISIPSVSAVVLLRLSGGVQTTCATDKPMWLYKYRYKNAGELPSKK